MRESYLGTVISVVVHSCVVSLLAASLTVHNTGKVLNRFLLIKAARLIRRHMTKKDNEAKPGLLKVKAPKGYWKWIARSGESANRSSERGLEPSPLPTVSASDVRVK